MENLSGVWGGAGILAVHATNPKGRVRNEMSGDMDTLPRLPQTRLWVRMITLDSISVSKTFILMVERSDINPTR